MNEYFSGINTSYFEDSKTKSASLESKKPTPYSREEIKTDSDKYNRSVVKVTKKRYVLKPD